MQKSRFVNRPNKTPINQTYLKLAQMRDKDVVRCVSFIMQLSEIYEFGMSD